MSVLLDEKDLQKLIVIGDRILIKPKVPQSKTKSGLLLPPGVNENEKVQIGYVVKVGPGYPIPSVNDNDEPWKTDQMNLNMFLFNLKRVIRLYICRIVQLKLNSIRKNILLCHIQPYCYSSGMMDFSNNIIRNGK